MKRLKILIILFIAALVVPLGWLLVHTYQGLQREERAELRFFAETLFDRMESEMADFVRREEARPIEDYRVEAGAPTIAFAGEGLEISPLTGPPEEPYILGYLQNNPDGSYETPLARNFELPPDEPDPLKEMLGEANAMLNRQRSLSPEPPPPPIPPPPVAMKDNSVKQEAGPAERYFQTQTREPKAHLGLEKKRTERITKDQALIVAQEDQRRDILAGRGAEREEAFDADMAGGASVQPMDEETPPEGGPALDPRLFRVEVDPMQAIFLDDDKIFIYRRIVIHDKVYRQGAVLVVREFMRSLTEQYFDDQPLASFAGLSLTARDHDRETARHEAGVPAASPVFQLERVFPRPFSFLEARLACDAVPRSPGRAMLMAVSVALGGVILIGLFAIYRSARVQVDLSERRTGFVSSVTHELKTPLTNIRMYIEMLEQGMAPNPEREQEYFRILGSESARLSRLINNVLEFSRVESKTRRFEPVEGDFREVLREAADVMGEKIRQEGFSLDLDSASETKFVYDREVMVQVLINLFENSLKFGRSSPERRISVALKPEGGWMNVRVADTGPGIPVHALKKVFDDFYRVDDTLTRTTRGAGIGLALVRKLVRGQGGQVAAENNRGPGCTIVISLPLKRRS